MPFDFIDRTSLLGDSERISERLQRLATGGVTSISIMCFDRDLESKIGTLTTVMQAVEQSGVRG